MVKLQLFFLLFVVAPLTIAEYLNVNKLSGASGFVSYADFNHINLS